MQLSIIIPVLNEKESLKTLVEEIKSQCHNKWTYQVIIVDDGSSDGTAEWVQVNFDKYPLKLIHFRKNRGKASALAAGFEYVHTPYVITMDGDLQDDPIEIDKMIEKLKQGFDLVSGWKIKRKDPLGKTLPSKLFNFTTSIFSGIILHDFNCGFKAYKKEVVKSVELYGDRHRYIPVLAHWQGFKVTEIPVHHRPRLHGKSKYGFGRFANGFFDLLTLLYLEKYSSRPLHVFGVLGLLFFFIGFGILGYFFYLWFIQKGLNLRPLLVGGFIAIVVGIQVVSIGLLGEMIVNKNRPKFPFQIFEKKN